MRKAKAPAFQFYVQDFLSGCALMKPSEVGCYILMLCHQWDHGSLPNDASALQMLCRSSEPVSDRVLNKFEIGEDGNLRNARLEKTRGDQVAYRERISGLRAEAAKKRWAHANALQEQSTSNALRKTEGEEEVLKKKKERAPDGFDAFWAAYPLKKAKAKAQDAWNKLKPEEAARCLPAIEAQVKANHFRGSDGQDYVPHGATWLNGHRWEDEVKVFAVVSSNVRRKPLTREEGFALMREIKAANGIAETDGVPPHLMTPELLDLFNR